jgi:hypothetical protein
MTFAWRRLLAAVVIGGIEAILLGPGAYAADPHLALNPPQGPSGTTVSAQGTGFCVSCGPVEIDFVAQPVKQGIAVGSDGSFQTTFMVPGGAQAGTDAVNVYQQGMLVTQTSFTVTPSVPAPTTTAAPPQTGTPAPGPNAGGGPGPGGGGSNPGGGAAAKTQPATTPTASPSEPGAAASNAGMGSSSGTTSSKSTAAVSRAIALSALALLVVAVAVALLYRRLRAN